MSIKTRSKLSVFVGTSLDGFIARKDGGLDWLLGGTDLTPKEYGYEAFIKKIDAIVMGRRTYEVGMTFETWPYGLPVIVLSTHPIRKPPQAPDAPVERMAGAPAAIVKGLAQRGLRRLYVDGAETIQRFFRAGLIDEITVSRLPVLLGEGIPLFGPLPNDVKLRHLRTRTFRGGMVQDTYAVQKPRSPRQRRSTRAGKPTRSRVSAVRHDG
jgi:dihydrofolate reductase